LAAIAGGLWAFDFVEECAGFYDGLEEVDGFGCGGDGLVAEGFVGIDDGDVFFGKREVDVVDGIGDELAVVEVAADLEAAGDGAFGALFAEFDAGFPCAVGLA